MSKLETVIIGNSDNHFGNYHIKIVDIDSFFIQIGDDSSRSLRLKTFKEKGLICINCGVEATICSRDGRYCAKTNTFKYQHNNFYGFYNNAEVFLLTADHIISKSKGGEDSLNNTQPMCSGCNWSKKSSSSPFKVITNLESHIGKKCHVELWKTGCVFIYEGTENGLHILKTPKTNKIYKTNKRLLYTRADQCLLE